MRKVILYIGTSLDGYIAKEDGDVSWMHAQNMDSNTPTTYETFIHTVDTVIMGYHTYQQITTELTPNQWVYEELQTYVLTHRQLENKKNIYFTNESLQTIISSLIQTEGKHIWICGGANVVHHALQANIINEIHVAILPIILGSGIALFPESEAMTNLELIDTVQYHGICELRYKVK